TNPFGAMVGACVRDIWVARGGSAWQTVSTDVVKRLGGASRREFRAETISLAQINTFIPGRDSHLGSMSMCAERLNDVQGRRAGDLAQARAAAPGDLAARRAITQRLFDRVRSTVMYIAAGHPDADDFVQLALLEVLGSLESFRAETRLESWA